MKYFASLYIASFIWCYGAMIAQDAQYSFTKRATRAIYTNAIVMSLGGPVSLIPVAIYTDGFFHGWKFKAMPAIED